MKPFVPDSCRNVVAGFASHSSADTFFSSYGVSLWGIMSDMLFEELAIPDAVLKGIKAANFTRCTPVQTAALPVALAGRDVAVQAQTGTGKTAVFLITLFSRMLRKPGPRRGPSPRALIVAPTRELVAQIDAEARRLGQFTNFSIAPVFGGMDYKKQKESLGEGVDIIIG